MKRLLAIAVFTLGLSSFVNGQVYPVQASLQIAPPYSLQLPDYVAPGSERMAMNVILNDMSRGQLDVQLRVTIEGQGIRIQTNPAYNPQPITLITGFNTRLIASDLEPYFRPANLNFAGLNRTQFVNSGGKLPEGVYRFCIEVLEYNRDVKVSNATCVTAWLILNDPPIINLPKMAEKLEPTNPQYVRFQWTPRHTGSPNSAFGTEYEFSIVELWPAGRNPNDAILTTQPIYQSTTFGTSLIYGPAEPPLVRGRQYAFRVQAKGKVGIEQLDLFRNSGYSQVHTFTYGDECMPPTELLLEATSSRKIKATWATDPVHSGFLVRYRQQGQENWTESNVLFEDFTIDGLQPDTFYEVQVSGACGFVNSAPTDIKRVRTQAEIAGEFECGSAPEAFNLDNHNPLPSLQRGDVIKAGDFDISMIEVSGANGTFSGTGQLVMPMMNNVKMGAAFTGIKVNDEYRMYEGKMHFSGLTVQALTDDQLADINQAFDDIASIGQEIDQIMNFSQEVMDSINAIINEIQNTEVFTEQEYTDLISEDMDAGDLKEQAQAAAMEAVAAVAGGDIMEAAKQVAKSRAMSKRAALKGGQAAQSDTVKTQAVEFVSGGEGMDTGPGHLAIEPHYFKIVTDNGDAYGPWFSVRNGQSTTIIVKWLQDSQVPKDEITFTLGNQALQAQSTSTGWELSIPAGTPQEHKVLKALHEGNTVGIAAVVTYKRENRNVVLVSINGAGTPSAAEAAEYLNDIYGAAMVDWTVTTQSITISNAWDANSNGSLYLGENNDLSTYTDEAKALLRLAKEKLTVDDDKYYLLFINTENSLDADGYMPRKKQFGFIFKNDKRTIAHELGHGAFRLAHTWEEFPNLNTGETQNIMDYAAGAVLRKYQWDQIHDPAWVMSLFDDEEEGAGETKIERRTDYIVYNGYATFITPAGLPFTIKPSGEIAIVTTTILEGEIYTGDYQITSGFSIGTLFGFEENGIWYSAVFEREIFVGYKDQEGVNPKFDNITINYDEPYKINTINALGQFETFAGFYNLPYQYGVDEYDGSGSIVYPINTDIYKTLVSNLSEDKYFEIIEELSARLKANIGSKKFLHIDEVWDADQELEVKDIRDRLEVFHTTTGNSIFVDIIYTQQKPTEQQISSLAEDVLVKAEVKDDKSIVYLVIPVWHETDITTNLKSIDKNRYTKTVYSSNAVYSNISELQGFKQSSSNVFDAILNFYSLVPKPNYADIFYISFRGEIIKFDSKYSENVVGRKNIYEFFLFADNRHGGYLSVLKEYYALKNSISQGIATTYQKESFNRHSTSLDDFELNNVFSGFTLKVHGIYESRLSIRDESGSVNALKHTRWFLDKNYRDDSFGTRSFSESLPSSYFLRGVNETVYQENIDAIERLSLVLSPFQVDFIADLGGVVYAGYYKDWETSTEFGVGVVLVGIEGAVIWKFAKGSKKVIKTTSGYALDDVGRSLLASLKAKYPSIAAWLDEVSDNVDLLNRLDKLPIELVNNFLDDFEVIKEAIRRNPDLVDSWKVLSDASYTASKVDIPTLNFLNKFDEIGEGALKTKLLSQLEDAELVKFSDDFVEASDDVLINISNDNELLDLWKKYADAFKGTKYITEDGAFKTCQSVLDNHPDGYLGNLVKTVMDAPKPTINEQVLVGVTHPSFEGKVFMGSNFKSSESTLEATFKTQTAHPLIRERIKYMDFLRNSVTDNTGNVVNEALAKKLLDIDNLNKLTRAGRAGYHGEVRALSDALYELEKTRPVTSSTLSEFDLFIRNSSENVMQRCPCCFHITQGVKVLEGN